jgi:type I restriction enzyme R subunit
VPSESREQNVRLIDFRNPENNIFQVTDEWRHRGAAFANRADVVFLINGVPVAVAEALAQAYEDRQIVTREALERFESLADQVASAETEMKWAARHWAAYVGVRVPQTQIRQMT